VNQIVYGLPAGKYEVSTWTYSSAPGDRNQYVAIVSPWADINVTEKGGSCEVANNDGWVKVTSTFILTEPADVAFGFFAGQVARTAGFDNWKLTRIGDATVSKTITAAGWATYCSPYALDFTNTIANLEAAYTITGHEGNSLTLSPVTGTIPANTGILLKGSGECLIPVVASSTTDVSTNKLQGVTTETNKEANTILVLLNGDNGVGFYKNNKAFTVGANTAYLNVGDVTASRSFYDLGEGTTAIENIKVGSKDNVYYNLQGQRILYPTKGLYIVNGKKVIIK
jgi:hypothetical protein